MDYKETKGILEKATSEEFESVDPEDFAEAIEKSLQAVKDCLEMGLTGEGD